VKNTIIYLVRHAEVYNPRCIIYGRLPGFRLSERGRFQAERLRDWFETQNISLIYTSPLLRAEETAEIISGGKIPIEINGNINEVDYKKWEGLRADERPLSEVEEYVIDPAGTNLGEKLFEVEKRMRKVIDSILAKYPGENIIMVSHADPILVTLMSYEKKPLSEINRHELKNASITSIQFDENGNFTKSDYNEIVDAKRDMP
jgi:broad specificity phosphatase PhoE